MYLQVHLLFFILSVPFLTTNAATPPSVNDFKQAFEKKMQYLKPTGYEKRTVKFVQVTPGKATGSNYPFKVSAYIHDYDEGYSANNYYGQSCLGKIDNWIFTMYQDEFDEWIVQGKFSVTGDALTCADNPSQGVMSIPMEAVPGTEYKPVINNPGNQKPTTVKTETNKQVPSSLYIGEYACYGTGGRLMAGMGFTLLNGGNYYDLDKRRGGKFTYNAQKATISFSGGFLGGQTGKNVTATGFQLSNTVYCEPWK